MKRYFVQRLLLLLPTLFGALTLVFVMIHLIPGDPVEVMLGETATSADKQELRRNLGLDQPLLTQYRIFLTNLATGDLGRSLYEQTSVGVIIGARLPATLQLALCAMIAALVISFSLAILAAVNRGRWLDRGALLFSLLGLSLPNFWLGPLLMIVFSIQLGWTPVSGRGGISHLILPALTLGLGMAAILTRILRASLLQTMHEDFVRTARAKGASEGRVVWRHGLGNALIPVVTILALSFGSLFSGALITETMFAWPGMGKTIYDSILGNDYNLALVGLLFATLLTLLSSLAADLLYIWLDPRIDLQ